MPNAKKDTKPAKRGRPPKCKPAADEPILDTSDDLADIEAPKRIIPSDDDLDFAELGAREYVAKVELLEAKVVQLGLQNKEKIIALEAKCGALTYIQTALEEFGKGMGAFMAELRNMPDHLQNACNLTPAQYKGAQVVVDEILERLGRVEFHLDSSATIDRKASELQAKTKESATQRKSAIIAGEAGK